MDYKPTLNLPKTAFPMKANLPQTEPQMLAWWSQIGIYKRLREAATDRVRWILHDGPPYANGNIHMGHVLNKVLKDIVVKSRTMLGFNAVYVPGFDCHGLPIEHQVDKELGLDQPGVDVRRAMDPVEKIRRCRAYAQKYVDIQSEEFQRLGVFGDWEHPYLTMSPAYEGVIAREFARLVGRGLVYKGLKPVHWCMYCKTALAQAEVEYEEQRTPSVYVKFPLVAPLPAAAGAPASLVIWTTTPWTLPANLAIAVHPTEEYVALRAGNDVLIVAAKLADEFVRTAKLTGTQVVGRMPGRALDGLEYRHPWIERTGKVAVADFVAMDTGTGLVHVAPGHGEEDYDLGRALGLRIYNPVDDDGRFVREVAHFAGMTVWEANPKIVEHLRRIGALLAEVTLTHTYPHCWRCKNPTLFRATEQWFVALDRQGLRARTLDAIRRDVRWIPTWGEDRIFNMVAHRPDWTLSRQRVWGVPIVAFYCDGCDALLLEEPVIEHVARLFGDGRGIEEWYLRAVPDLLPPGTRCRKCGGITFRKGTDTLDVWFDSGCSHAAVLETRPELTWPAELYLEGSDQHRGWFHSSLLEAMATREAPPYRAVLTCGFVVDGDGRKMSKSVGNVVSPQDLLPKYGAEILRLWVAAEDYTEDIRLSSLILDRLADAYRRIRNTFRFLLGNLSDFDPARDRQPYARLDEVDRFVLDRLARLIDRVRRAYEEYQFHTVFHAVHNFCAVDLSALYLDVIKDRLYTSAPTDPRRRAAQTTCYDIFRALARMMAPILTFTSEEAWRYVPGARAESVHLERFPEVPVEWLDDTLDAEWSRLLEVRREIAKALETARAQGLIGSGLEAAVTIAAAPEDLPELLRRKRDLLPTLLIVSQVGFDRPASKPAVVHESQEIPGLVIGIDRARGRKCERCWMWTERVGESAAHPGLCERCLPIVTARS
ncbi:MAG: isoleucine--tRNA ligase [Candidatus Rokubacteria bacterium 13_2_20CM_2_64_8]|nr:MAG: isoleucine--tRNA ligase [Candidatus Rokubacteria bacterium 13_2_20CM_2_64_8]OLC61527.1 MAG: isoleucine--tRNA ligase [Candidatus Rokubacteria bacterium 13_1_40CM_4_67_11]